MWFVCLFIVVGGYVAFSLLVLMVVYVFGFGYLSVLTWWWCLLF